MKEAFKNVEEKESFLQKLIEEHERDFSNPTWMPLNPKDNKMSDVVDKEGTEKGTISKKPSFFKSWTYEETTEEKIFFTNENSEKAQPNKSDTDEWFKLSWFYN